MAKVKSPQFEIPDGVDPKFLPAFEAIKNYFDQLQGNTRAPLERVPTLQELKDAGLIDVTVKNNFAEVRAAQLAAADEGGGGGGTTIIVTPGGGTGGGGGGGGGGGPIDPPTTASGLAATGAFQNIILTWSPATYVGHDYTEIFRSDTNNRAAAVSIGSSPGSQYADPVGMGKTYFYWIRYVNRNGVQGNFNAGINAGVQGQTALINEADLAVASISAAKIMDSVIGLTKFANTIRPVEIVSTLPTSGNVEGRMAFLTTDGKLYRYTAGDWTSQIPATDIDGQITTTQIGPNSITSDKLAANSVIAGKIAAGAISASEIAAGAIRADKLGVGRVGSALNVDPNMQDASAWTKLAGVDASFETVSDGRVGNNVVVNSQTIDSCQYRETKWIPIDPSKDYRVRFLVRKREPSATTTTYGGVALRDAAGDNIPGDGTYWYYFAILQPTTSWQEVVGQFGAGTDRPIPAEAREASILFLLNYPPGVAGSHEIQDFRIEEILPATLIADGAITTDKVAANAITGVKIAAGSITAGSAIIADGAILRAKIADAAIDDAKIANLSAVKITTGTLDAERIAVDGVTIDTVEVSGQRRLQIKAASITDAHIANASITSAKIASLNVDKLIGDTSKFVVAANSSVGTLNDPSNYVQALVWDLPASAHPGGHWVYVTATIQTMDAFSAPYPPGNPYGNFVQAEVEMRVTYAEVISGVEQPEVELGYQIADLRRQNRTVVSAGHSNSTTNLTRLRIYARNVFSSSNGKIHVVRADGVAMGLR